jgi:hypothetical protein
LSHSTTFQITFNLSTAIALSWRPFVCSQSSPYFVVTNIFSGISLPKIGYQSVCLPFQPDQANSNSPALYFASGTLIAIGGSLVFTITLDSPAPHVYGYSALIAFGCGMSFNLGYTIAGVKIALKGDSVHDVKLGRYSAK